MRKMKGKTLYAALGLILGAAVALGPAAAQVPPSAGRTLGPAKQRALVNAAAKKVSKETGVPERALKARANPASDATEEEILALMRAEAKATLEDRALLKEMAADLKDLKDQKLAQDADRALNEGRTEDFIKAYAALQAEMEKVAINQSDEQTWQRIAASGEETPLTARIEMIQNYLAIFPTGKHDAEARTMLTRLSSEQQAQEAEAARQAAAAKARMEAEKLAAEQARLAEIERVKKATPWLAGYTSRTFRYDSSGIYSVAFAPQGRTIALGGGDGKIRLVNATDGVASKTLDGHKAAVNQLIYSRSGKLLLSVGLDGNAQLWSADKGAIVMTIAGGISAVTSVSFSPDEREVAVGSSDGSVRIVDVESKSWSRIVVNPAGNRNDVSVAVAFTPQGDQILVGMGGYYVFLDPKRTQDFVTDGSRYPTITAFNVKGQPVFSSDGKMLSLGDGVLYSAVTRQSICYLVQNGPQYSKRAVFSRDGRFAAMIVDDLNFDDVPQITRLGCDVDPEVKMPKSGGTIGLSQLLATPDGHSVRVQSADFSPDGRVLATASADGQLTLWSDASTGAKTGR